MNDSKKIGLVCIMPLTAGILYTVYTEPMIGVICGCMISAAYGVLKLTE